ncbi:MAG: D-alanyl-D-alanine carboxypeptidase family protein [Oscillospiraceae bacterium]
MKTVTLRREQIHTGSLILVNAQHPYHEDAGEHTLLAVDPKTPQVLLEAHAAAALSRLMDKLNGWKQITAVSGWRSREEQQEIYAQSLRDSGRVFTQQFVALPGHSEHQTGLAIDLARTQEHIDFIRPDFPYSGICQVFRQYMASYGFVERYPCGKEAITGIAWEPWHFRYVGTPHAAIMEQHGFVLEEYISFLKDYPYGKKWYTHWRKETCAEISYLEADKAADTRLEVDDCVSYTISGNNSTGYVITEWRA